MGLDDLFKQRGHGHHNDHRYYGGQHGHHGGIGQYLYLFEKLKSNKKLLTIIAVAAVALLIIAIAVIIMLIPFIVTLLGSIQKSGLKGLIETAKPWLELLWSGAGK